jgi:hypothetical protein
MTHSEHSKSVIGALPVGAIVVGALAFGALAIGAVAIARIAVWRMAVGKLHLKSAEIDELTVRRLRVLEAVPGYIAGGAGHAR